MHASLKHPNIIQAYLGMEDKAGVRLFMEYAGDSDAYSYINAKQRLSLREDDARQLVYDVLTALQYMHCQVGLGSTGCCTTHHHQALPLCGHALYLYSCYTTRDWPGTPAASCSILHAQQSCCPAAAMSRHHAASRLPPQEGPAAWWGWCCVA